jgi:hypothetical protein
MVFWVSFAFSIYRFTYRFTTVQKLLFIHRKRVGQSHEKVLTEKVCVCVCVCELDVTNTLN